MHISAQTETPATHDAAPILVPLERAAAMLGVAERTVRELIRSGDLPCRRLGRLVMIERRAIEDFVAALPHGRAAGVQDRFEAARQAFLRAADNWLASGPPAADASDEIGGTLSAIRQIATLRGVSVEGAGA